MKQSRKKLLEKMRRPNASAGVVEEVQRLIAQEQNASSCSSVVSVDDLLLLGKLKESEYLDIIYSLEDALRQDEEEEELRHMADLEDAEFEAMLAGMELKDEPQKQNSVVVGEKELQTTAQSISVLCPVCKVGYLREETHDEAALPFILCICGFTFNVQHVRKGVLRDFQDKIVNAFMTHRDSCYADPIFNKEIAQDDSTEVLSIKCARCGYDHVLP
ncbi:hypothetical protein PsorP6_007594 [Peronosclerospora sorghi]|uniref:Uncharacterized protein n=1 Tax=Peronosclerospora sorghi TaxID=230839 RepID=A0ACC0W9L5_9STRA|nr:hypothetical protein PsorP6_007594 [Peronosclerospora sorghi]